MQTFSLRIDSGFIGSLVIQEGQGWLAHINSFEQVSSFLDWLEGRKYDPEAFIEYKSSDISSSDLYVIRHFISIQRFRISENEADNFYYQQRYNASENDDIQTLGEYLGVITEPYFEELSRRLGLNRLLPEKINMLSTGEFRKSVTLKSAMTRPRVIFIDEPWEGLDSTTRQLLNELFLHMINQGTSIVVFTSRETSPGFLTHRLEVGKPAADGHLQELSGMVIPDPRCSSTFTHAFQLKNIRAGYYGHDVLHDVSWSVKCNEKWSLTGLNGAGKSTLLSFVYADNPQVYSNNVFLFDKKRGSGESIWEIKDQIGFYSTELHRFFNKMQTVESAINSIVHQNPYEKRVLSNREDEFRISLLTWFNLIEAGEKLMCELPAVIQKLVILTGIFVKNAPLLILDEPFQGFSEPLIRKVLALIERYVKDRTFIMVSHNNSDFPECLDRHFHMRNGTGMEIDHIPEYQDIVISGE